MFAAGRSQPAPAATPVSRPAEHDRDAPVRNLAEEVRVAADEPQGDRRTIDVTA